MNIVTKFTSPTKFDFQPKGTIWENKVDDNESIYYVQTCDDETPNWDKLSIYLEKAIKSYFNKNIKHEQLEKIFSDLFI